MCNNVCPIGGSNSNKVQAWPSSSMMLKHLWFVKMLYIHDVRNVVQLASSYGGGNDLVEVQLNIVDPLPTIKYQGLIVVSKARSPFR